MGGLLELQEKLSGFSPVTPPERVPAEALKSGAAVIFTAVDIAHESLSYEISE